MPNLYHQQRSRQAVLEGYVTRYDAAYRLWMTTVVTVGPAGTAHVILSTHTHTRGGLPSRRESMETAMAPMM